MFTYSLKFMHINIVEHKSSKRALDMQLALNILGDSGFDTNPPKLAVNGKNRCIVLVFAVLTVALV